MLVLDKDDVNLEAQKMYDHCKKRVNYEQIWFISLLICR